MNLFLLTLASLCTKVNSEMSMDGHGGRKNIIEINFTLSSRMNVLTPFRATDLKGFTAVIYKLQQKD